MRRIIRSGDVKSFADMKMGDFEEGMYRMDDGSLVDFNKVDDGYYDYLADIRTEPERFAREVRHVAEMIGVKPSVISDKNGWKNLRMIFYEIYDGKDIADGAEYLYCETETIGNWCLGFRMRLPMR